MEYGDIFEKANELIACLDLVDSNDFVDYIVEQVSQNGVCTEEGYKDFMAERYN